MRDAFLAGVTAGLYFGTQDDTDGWLVAGLGSEAEAEGDVDFEQILTVARAKAYEYYSDNWRDMIFYLGYASTELDKAFAVAKPATEHNAELIRKAVATLPKPGTPPLSPQGLAERVGLARKREPK